MPGRNVHQYKTKDICITQNEPFALSLKCHIVIDLLVANNKWIVGGGGALNLLILNPKCAPFDEMNFDKITLVKLGSPVSLYTYDSICPLINLSYVYPCVQWIWHTIYYYFLLNLVWAVHKSLLQYCCIYLWHCNTTTKCPWCIWCIIGWNAVDYSCITYKSANMHSRYIAVRYKTMSYVTWKW